VNAVLKIVFSTAQSMSHYVIDCLLCSFALELVNVWFKCETGTPLLEGIRYGLRLDAGDYFPTTTRTIMNPAIVYA
jgi:hypothetical protein